MAAMRPELLRRLRESLATWDPAPMHASLFGSTARADGGVESDVDLFLVRPAGVAEDDPAWRRQVELLAADIFAWTGNHAAIIEQDTREVGRLRRSPPPVLDALMQEGITLAGAAVDELPRPSDGAA